MDNTLTCQVCELQTWTPSSPLAHFSNAWRTSCVTCGTPLMRVTETSHDSCGKSGGISDAGYLVRHRTEDRPSHHGSCVLMLTDTWQLVHATGRESCSSVRTSRWEASSESAMTGHGLQYILPKDDFVKLTLTKLKSRHFHGEWWEVWFAASWCGKLGQTAETFQWNQSSFHWELTLKVPNCFSSALGGEESFLSFHIFWPCAEDELATGLTPVYRVNHACQKNRWVTVNNVLPCSTSHTAHVNLLQQSSEQHGQRFVDTSHTVISYFDLLPWKWLIFVNIFDTSRKRWQHATTFQIFMFIIL